MKNSKKPVKPFGLEMLVEIKSSELENTNGGASRGKVHTMAISMPLKGHKHPDSF